MTKIDIRLILIYNTADPSSTFIVNGYVHRNFIVIQTLKQCDMYINEYIFHMHYYGVFKQRHIKLRHLINAAWLSPIEQSYINIIIFLLYNYYGESSLFHTANIIYKYDIFNLYRNATYSHTDQNARDATFIWGPRGG